MKTPSQIEAALDALRFKLRLIAPFLADPDVQEIAVNWLGEVVLWRNGAWEHVGVPGLDYSMLEAIGENLANFSSKPFDRENTSLSAHLPSGERIEMTHPPTSPEHLIYLNIRKHSSKAFPHSELAAKGYYERTRHEFSLNLTDERREFYAQYISADELALWQLASTGRWALFMERSVALFQNIIVSGATGSGKTSYLRSLVNLVPSDQRILTVEDTPEMPLENHPNSQALFYRRDGEGEGDSVEGVLRSVMRKTPTRVYLAELRGPEALYFLSGVLSSGHPGGGTTVHSDSPKGAISRCALLIKSSPTGQGIELETIMNLLYMTVNVVVQLKFEMHEAPIGRLVPSIYYDPMYRLSLMG